MIMNYNELLTDARWNLIKELSEKDQTPTDLAKKTSTSIANISQQLRLLEAYGFVKKDRQKNSKEPGKPKTIFSLNKELVQITTITDNFSERKNLELDYIQKAILNLWILEKKENQYFLEKFIYCNQDLIKKIDAIGIVKTEADKIELLILTEALSEIREKYSNQTIDNIAGEKKKIICWTHNLEEIKQGLRSNNEHFINITAKLKPFLDKNGYLKEVFKLKKEMKDGINKQDNE